MGRKNIFFIIIFSNLLIFSCEKIHYRVVECPQKTREATIIFAQKYIDKENEFLLGGRDYLEKEGILQLDCSGFIVRVYEYAVKGTKYSLLFDDAPLSAIYQYFNIPIEQEMLTPGDLIFMGNPPAISAHISESESFTSSIVFPPTHLSLFVRMDDENIYFMDATFIEEMEIDGVSIRFYPKDDSRFMSYGRMLVRY